jgi:alkanesulfonate monooxygenase SsuD/methylene tetrahydromethanopterin reductase-like flavin-dependent oxidoreductase (luciferase family)
MMAALAFGIRGNLPPQFAAEVARAAEVKGYRAFWITAGLGPPSLGLLAAAAKVTSTIALGMGAIPLSHCTPKDVLAEVRRWDLPQGRLIVGVGSGFQPIPLTRFASYIDELTGGLSCPVVVGAMGPRTCALAGRTADGVLLTLVTPDHARRSIGWVAGGAAEAGRPAPRSYAYMSTAVGEDSLEQLREEARTFVQYPAFVRHFERLGTPPETAGIAVRSLDELPAGLADWDGVVDQVIIRTTRHANSLEQTLALLESSAPS